MEQFATSQEILSVKTTVLPKIRSFEVKILEFDKKSKENIEIIKRFDNIILEKASKFRVESIELELEKFAQEDKKLLEHINIISKK